MSRPGGAVRPPAVAQAGQEGIQRAGMGPFGNLPLRAGDAAREMKVLPWPDGAAGPHVLWHSRL